LLEVDYLEADSLEKNNNENKQKLKEEKES